MKFHVLTLFPEMIEQGLNTSITGRAISNGLLSIEAINIRDYAFNKHQSVDDYPYGGGAGMLMQAEPVYLAYEAVRKKIAERKPAEAETEEPAEAEQLEEKPVTGSEEEPVKEKKLRVVYLSPQGDVFSQGMAEELAKEQKEWLINRETAAGQSGKAEGVGSISYAASLVDLTRNRAYELADRYEKEACGPQDAENESDTAVLP